MLSVTLSSCDSGHVTLPGALSGLMHEINSAFLKVFFREHTFLMTFCVRRVPWPTRGEMPTWGSSSVENAD